MVLIRTFSLYIEIRFCAIGKRFKKMEKHFRWHVSNFFSFEFDVPDQPGSPSKVYGYLGEAIIHGQQ